MKKLINPAALGAVFLLVLIAFSCKKDQNNLESYYFPFEKLKEGMVYEYQSVNNDSLVPEYWYYRSFEGENRERFITAQSYDHAFNVTQFSREELVRNGSLMVEYRLYEFDSTDQTITIEPIIKDPNVFPFSVSKEGGFLRFKLEWQEALDPQMHVTLSRGRQFQKFINFQMQDVILPCAEFATTELAEFDHDDEGHREYGVSSRELYAKGIGLVYYRKVIDKNFVFEYELAERYSLEELEKKIGK